MNINFTKINENLFKVNNQNNITFTDVLVPFKLQKFNNNYWKHLEYQINEYTRILAPTDDYYLVIIDLKLLKHFPRWDWNLNKLQIVLIHNLTLFFASMFKYFVFIIASFFLLSPPALTDERARNGKCYVAIGYANDRSQVSEMATNSFINSDYFELFERWEFWI